MKRYTTIVAVLFALCAGSTLAGDNLLRNTSFETQGSGQYTAEYWEWDHPDQDGSTWGNVSRESWRYHSGTYLAVIKGKWSAGLDYGGWWQKAEVNPGDTVNAGAWFWADSNWTASEQVLRIEFYGTGGDRLGQVQTNLSHVGQSWIWISVEGVAPEYTAWAQFVVLASGAGSSGALQFDDVDMHVVGGKTEDFDGWGSASSDGCHEFDDWILCEGKAISNENRYVIISKYVQGTSVDNALEIYNDTDSDIDMGEESFVLQIYIDGASSNPRSIALEGVLAAKGTFVIGNSTNWGASEQLAEYLDIENGSMRYMEGNDAVVLRKGGASGTVIDSIGQVGNNPGSGGWGVSTNSTLKHTLVRKKSVTSGRTDAWSAFTPIYEWDAYPDHTYSNLGSYVISDEGYRPTDISISIADGLGNYLQSPEIEEGLGQINFWYALEPSSPTLSYRIDMSADSNTWLQVGSFTATSTNYEKHSLFIYSLTNHYYRLSHTSGAGRLQIDYIDIADPSPFPRDQEFEGWPDSATNVGTHSEMGWTISTGKLTQTDAYSGYAFQTEPSPGNYVQSPFLTNGCGTVAFLYRRADGSATPITVALETSYDGTNWYTHATQNGIDSTSYKEFSYYLYITNPVYVRLLQSAGANSLLLDSITIDNPIVYREQNFDSWPEVNYGVHSFEGWSISNGLVNSIRAFYGQAARLQDTVYLHANIQSPYLPEGVGSIDFKYAWWGYGTKPTYLIQKSIDGTNWNTIESLYITNNYENYMTYSKYVYDPTSKYVRIYHESGASRALFDEISIEKPRPPADVSLSGWTEPFIPQNTDDVYVVAHAIASYGATEITPVTWYRVGTNGGYTAISMEAYDAVNFRTTSAIPAQAIGTRVDYYIRCDFGGPGSELTSPHYHPSTGATNPAWYAIAREPSGMVWINELNYINDWWESPDDDTNEFVEIAGPAGWDISGWKVNLYIDASVTGMYNQYATYTIPDGTVLSNESDGFGFYVVGDPDVANIDMMLTYTNDRDSTHIFDGSGTPGGIKILNEANMLEQALSYQGPIQSFVEANAVDPGDGFIAGVTDPYGINLSGTGGAYSAFTWVTNIYTPGAVNIDQQFDAPAPPPEVYILSVHMTTNIVIETTWTNGWNYTPWYATNLPTGEQNWIQVAPFYNDQEGSTNTIWFDFPAGNDCQYFRVRATD